MCSFRPAHRQRTTPPLATQLTSPPVSCEDRTACHSSQGAIGEAGPMRAPPGPIADWKHKRGRQRLLAVLLCISAVYAAPLGHPVAAQRLSPPQFKARQPSPQPPIYGPPIAYPILVSYPPNRPPSSTFTCKAQYSIPGTSTGKAQPPVCPDKYDEIDGMCYSPCADRTWAPVVGNETMCGEPCDLGFTGEGDQCEPNNKCDNLALLKTTANGTELCVMACPPTYTENNLQQCGQTCSPGLSVCSTCSQDGRPCCATRRQLCVSSHQVLPRWNTSITQPRPRKLQARTSVPPHCGVGQVEAKGLCVAACASSSYSLTYNVQSDLVTCTLPNCPHGSSPCGTYCMEQNMALRLTAVCDAVNQALDNMGNGRGCGGACYC